VQITVLRSVPARIALVVTLLAAAAFASTTASAGATSGVDKAAAALVPAKIKAKGAVTVAEDATYAPDEFIGPDGHTVIGMDADLAKAIFPLLGLKVNVVNVTFGLIIPGLASGKYDVSLSSFTDKASREKVVDFVDYYRAGTSFFEKASGGPKVTNLDSICGLRVAVESTTTEETDANTQAAKCKSEGKKPDTVLPYPKQTDANLALASGRAQVGMADSPIAAYQVKQSKGTFKVVGQSYGVAPYGIAVRKHNGTFDTAILAAVKDLIKSGKYASILKTWGVEAGADTRPVINGASGA
jgi:polar amino acid transport system substrate-binding protein